jgi:hypothetical protein
MRKTNGATYHLELGALVAFGVHSAPPRPPPARAVVCSSNDPKFATASATVTELPVD